MDYDTIWSDGLYFVKSETSYSHCDEIWVLILWNMILYGLIVYIRY
jgi:hypothetical protein